MSTQKGMLDQVTYLERTRRDYRNRFLLLMEKLSPAMAESEAVAAMREAFAELDTQSRYWLSVQAAIAAQQTVIQHTANTRLRKTLQEALGTYMNGVAREVIRPLRVVSPLSYLEVMPDDAANAIVRLEADKPEQAISHWYDMLELAKRAMQTANSNQPSQECTHSTTSWTLNMPQNGHGPTLINLCACRRFGRLNEGHWKSLEELEIQMGHAIPIMQARYTSTIECTCDSVYAVIAINHPKTNYVGLCRCGKKAQFSLGVSQWKPIATIERRLGMPLPLEDAVPYVSTGCDHKVAAWHIIATGDSPQAYNVFTCTCGAFASQQAEGPWTPRAALARRLNVTIEPGTGTPADQLLNTQSA